MTWLFFNIIFIFVPGVYLLNLNGFRSAMNLISLLVILKYCNITFPFVEAPYPWIVFPDLIIFSILLEDFDLIIFIFFSNFWNVVILSILILLSKLNAWLIDL